MAASTLRRRPGMQPALEFMRLLWELDHALQVRSKRMLRTIGLTGPQRLVLRLLAMNPGLGANQLASLLHTHPSTLTGVLQRLEERSILRREPDAKDGRRIRLWLTPRGLGLNRPRSETIEAAIRQSLARHRSSAIDQTTAVITTLVRVLLAPQEAPHGAARRASDGSREHPTSRRRESEANRPRCSPRH